MHIVKQRQFPVQWHEGMLLSPQHFQQDQVYRDIERQHHLTMSEPYYWGLVDLEFDQSSLLSGELSLRSVYGMMPDGLIVNYDDKLDAKISISLGDSPNLELGGSVATVYLVVPIRDKGAAFQRAEIQRFDSMQSSEPVVDENTGENAVEVYRLRPRYGLYVGESPPGKYVAMPIARVRKENDGTFKTTEYVPPTRRFHSRKVGSSEALFTTLERLVQALRQKAIQLSGIAESDATGLSRDARAKKREMSEILGSVLPSLELTLSADIHPFNAYSTFCNAIGALVKLTANPVPPKFPPYDHNDMRASFNVVIACLASLINTIKSHFKLLQFDLEGDQFSIQLEKPANSETLTIEVRGELGVSERHLKEYVQSARIVSESMLRGVGQKRLLGAQRKLLTKPIFESESERARVVVLLSASDPSIRFGERLIITSASQKSDQDKPESIWLYST